MRVNIYIRKENEEAWNNIKDKSGWINSLLQVRGDKAAREQTLRNIETEARIKGTPTSLKPKKAVEELKKLADIKTADEIAIKAFNDEECQGHEVRMNCGLRNCKYA